MSAVFPPVLLFNLIILPYLGGLTARPHTAVVPMRDSPRHLDSHAAAPAFPQEMALPAAPGIPGTTQETDRIGPERTKGGGRVKTLPIDNYDSYTYNLFQLIAEVNGEEPVVIRNDSPGGIPDLAEFDNVVVSPGPGHPGKPRDFGIASAVLAESPLPVLGVCPGHRASRSARAPG